MITDIEMEAMRVLMNRCEEPVAKSIVSVVQNMFGELDANGFKSAEEKADFINGYASEINRVVEAMTVRFSNKKRMIGDYEVINSFLHGDKEVFLGENRKAFNDDERFICGFCVNNGIFESYEDCLCSDNYNEIAEIYSQRVNEQIQSVKDSLAKIPFDRTIIGKDSCDSISDVNLEGKIVVVDPEFIKREYVGADRQLCIATGGFGCNPESGNKKVFCKNIFTGEDVTWYRGDILGTIKPECVPQWVKDRITNKPLEVLFTFGSSEQFPFKMGYISIIAPSLKDAIAEFRRNYPDKHEGVLNCADYYYKEDDVANIKEHGNGAGCHRSIDITVSIKGKTVDALLFNATNRSEAINNNITSKNDVGFEKE